MFEFIECVQDIRRERWVLTEEGKTYASVGSPEFQLFSAVPPEGIAREELQVQIILVFSRLFIFCLSKRS